MPTAIADESASPALEVGAAAISGGLAAESGNRPFISSGLYFRVANGTFRTYHQRVLLPPCPPLSPAVGAWNSPAELMF